MFGSIGIPELLIILAVALLVFGPKKLPEVGKSLGKAMREFKRTSEEIRGRIEDEIQASEIKGVAEDLRKDLQDIKSLPSSLTGEAPPRPAGEAAKDERTDGEGPKVS
jgi:sec-independent protein translocase protein TatA